MRALPILALLLIAGCQSTSRDTLEGSWASDDGVFVATFDNGAFNSRLTGTGETVVADGRYQRDATGLALSWTSIVANERRAAACQFVASNKLTCTPSVGQPFSMTRVV
ncbi:hypothetical protein [Acuticoccus mangrovi]|uniref:Uncharacterized protein n=1 Tax=Acuticoccus mangrovi TaxID=2796142 RepID=A0A934MFP6_9HYPH|nr:hypothetical protein [Acuticoccus mangrovi]MBJ3778887.1 hypothetical protein [Acuticoccus mangrovi]